MPEFRRYQSPGGRAYEAPIDLTPEERASIEAQVDAGGPQPSAGRAQRQPETIPPRLSESAIRQRHAETIDQTQARMRAMRDRDIPGRILESPPVPFTTADVGPQDPAALAQRIMGRESPEQVLGEAKQAGFLRKPDLAAAILPLVFPTAGTGLGARLATETARALGIGERGRRILTPIAEGVGAVTGLDVGARLGANEPPTRTEQVLTALAPAVVRAGGAGAQQVLKRGVEKGTIAGSREILNLEAKRQAEEAIAARVGTLPPEAATAYREATRLAKQARAVDVSTDTLNRATDAVEKNIATRPGLSSLRPSVEEIVKKTRDFIGRPNRAISPEEFIAFKQDINLAIREEESEAVKQRLFVLRRALINDGTRLARKDPVFARVFDRLKEADKAEMTEIAQNRLAAYLRIPGSEPPPGVTLPKLPSAVKLSGPRGDDMEISVRQFQKLVAKDETLRRVMEEGIGKGEHQKLLQALETIQQPPVLAPRRGANVGSFQKVGQLRDRLILSAFGGAAGSVAGGTTGAMIGVGTATAIPELFSRFLTSDRGRRLLVNAISRNPARVFTANDLGTLAQAATQLGLEGGRQLLSPVAAAQPRLGNRQ